MSNKGKQWRAGFVAYAPLIFWIALILFFSGSRGSVAETTPFFGPLLEFFFPSLSQEKILLYYVYVRKFLHFTVYAILGFLAFRACVSSLHVSKGSRHYNSLSLFMPLLIALAVALADEYIQSLDPSRTGTLYDVAIDMAGALTAVIILRVISPVSYRAKKV